MPMPCPDCQTVMYPADELECEKGNFICPECAPDFVLCRATSFSDLDPKEYGY